MNYLPTQDNPTLLRRLRRMLNGLSHRRLCCLCGHHFYRFSKFRGGVEALSPYLRQVEWISSDFDNFWCPYCRSHDRERHLVLYLEALKLWHDLKGASVLHIAPEKQLGRRVELSQPTRYIRGDLVPTREGVEQMDVTAINYPDQSFDLVICNHVLEHVPDDHKALHELLRVLKPGGRAILQTPYAASLEQSIEDPDGKKSSSERLADFGQEDHVRLYGRDLFERIQSVGFELDMRQHQQLLPDIDPARYGVNPREPLILALKPNAGTTINR